MRRKFAVNYPPVSLAGLAADDHAEEADELKLAFDSIKERQVRSKGVHLEAPSPPFPTTVHRMRVPLESLILEHYLSVITVNDSPGASLQTLDLNG